MKESIKKVIDTPMKPCQAYIYFNMHIVKSVFFGTGILKLILKQEEELKSIYESVILNKLGLNKTFPRKLLCTKKTSIVLGLLLPKTVLAMLSIKQFFREYKNE